MTREAHDFFYTDKKPVADRLTIMTEKDAGKAIKSFLYALKAVSEADVCHDEITIII